ncbi:hypothetical protein K2173_027036 [Erythroxylum novogranatense]|uniref:ABC transporter domain-containing protein n=1 Tax=Erythroxylum novogranatense TaxID=1862640 RepID=A0AAV8U0P1_9ROSI|nr:hypothetical protein K2173_027036 [Erythroxylum novogranatense]
MELRRGIPLLWQQFKALFSKNLLLSWRNKRATLLQLFASFFFILLLFCIDKATSSRNSQTTAFESVTDPLALVSPPIPPCEDKYYMRTPCFDFLWSGNSSSRLNTIVRSIMTNNPGRPIPASKVMSFRTSDEVDAWLLTNPMRSPGALHFREINATVIGYGLQTNSSTTSLRGQVEDPTFKFQIPLQIAAEREIARSVLGDSNFGWNFGFKEFAHPARKTFSVLASIGPSFFLAFAMFGFVLQIGSLIEEKELKLRQAMSMMGLYESAYWLSWVTWEGILVLISSLLLVLFGMMFQFDFFIKNNFAVVFLVFFLFQFNMIAFAFMLSAFVSKSSSATTVGFSLFIVGFLTQLVTVFGFPYKSQFSRFLRNIWSLYPPNLLASAVKQLADATDTPEAVGISWSRRAKCLPDDAECVITINDVYKWLISTFFVWLVLAIYFDNIFPNASGVRKPLFYFLMPGYWSGTSGNKVREGGICSCIGSVPQHEQISPDDEDVLEEENTVKKDTREGTVDPNVAVQIRGLVKTYAGTRNIGCCKCKKTPPYQALKGLWVNFSKDQLFCLLGPNGAGKTTAINCLTGSTPVTSGDALIYGYSVRSSVGMSNIQKIIGVCPQFDILWDALSGDEHLHLFANIKGLPPDSINSVAEELLAKVRLTESAKLRTRSYSGGMKRRLSVAIALIGDPKLVILDEPTTGMDPISRRHVWDIIQKAKNGRAIVLTTHSMEEADILSDRIGIMAKGRLRCIGTSIRLKSRFGTGFIANISFSETTGGNTPPYILEELPIDREPVKKFFKDRLDVIPAEETRSFLTFVIPHDKERLLTQFFTELEDRQNEFEISDIQLGLATLEEVFLNIAKQAELENATAEGRLVPLTLTSGASVQIPVGAQFVGVPGTETAENPRGIMVEVYWEEDDTGTLCISGHSAEMPIPPNAQTLVSAVPPSSRNILGRRAPVHGIVIELSQTHSHRTGSSRRIITF